MMRYEMLQNVLKKSKVSTLCVCGGGSSVFGFYLIDIDKYKGVPDFCDL